MSIYDCPVRGEAIAYRHNDGPPTWERSDPEVHVLDEFLEDAEALAFLNERYEVQEPCPFMRGVSHARLTSARPHPGHLTPALDTASSEGA